MLHESYFKEQASEQYTAEEETEREWESAIPFGGIHPPEIPASLLPSWLGQYVDAVSKNTQAPEGLGVMQALSVVATCLQRKFVVSPYGDDYREPLSLWTVTALPPATRKTAVVNALTAPLTEWERAEQERLKPEIAEKEAQRAVNLKTIDRLQNEAAKKESEQERAELIEKISKLKQETPDEIRPPRLWTSDATPERLQGLLAENGERMALLSDEGGIFEIMSGLYSDGRANIDVFLQAHAGRPVRVDRGSRHVFLDRPAFSFGLAVQPQIINEMAHGNKRRFRGVGALARFLFNLSKSNVGKRDVMKRVIIPEGLKAVYRDSIFHLLSFEYDRDESGNPCPWVLRLDEGALSSWLRFSQYIESNQGDGGEFEPIQDWTGKLPGAALRIAGNCHVVEHGHNTHIVNKVTMEKALDLAELAIKHAQATFERMGAEPEIDDAKVVLDWILRKKEIVFVRRECHRDLHGRFQRVDRLIRALNVLEERHYISGPEDLKTRKPTIVHHVNPEIFEEN